MYALGATITDVAFPQPPRRPRSTRPIGDRRQRRSLSDIRRATVAAVARWMEPTRAEPTRSAPTLSSYLY